GDRVHVAVSQATHRADAVALRVTRTGRIGTPDRLRPLRENAAGLGEILARVLALLIEEAGDRAGDLDTLRAIVRHAETNEQVSEPHDAGTDAADPLGEVMDLREGVAVRVDDVVEEVRGDKDHALKLDPVDVTCPVLTAQELRDLALIDR